MYVYSSSTAVFGSYFNFLYCETPKTTGLACTCVYSASFLGPVKFFWRWTTAHVEVYVTARACFSVYIAALLRCTLYPRFKFVTSQQVNTQWTYPREQNWGSWRWWSWGRGSWKLLSPREVSCYATVSTMIQPLNCDQLSSVKAQAVCVLLGRQCFTCFSILVSA